MKLVKPLPGPSHRRTTRQVVINGHFKTLRRLARRRLEAGLLDAREVEHLLRLEFGGRDDWLAYLLLTPWSEILDLLETRGPDDD